MRIRSLYIENFGGLQQKEMAFDDGMNVLCLPNGWGKSTLSVFIKAMLYGLPVSTKRSLIENERKRYTPWQGGVFGGSMVIELDGRQYRIERTFGAKEAEDTLAVSDAVTGEPVQEPWAQEVRLGEQLLGVDAAAYERSTYLSQRQIDESDGDLSIHAKLNRLVDATDDLASYDAAMELLDKQRKYYTVSGGRRGAIADTEAEIEVLREQITQARQASALAEQAAGEILQLEQARAQNEQKQRALRVRETEHHRLGERLAQARHYRSLCAALEQKQALLEECLRGVGGEVPSEERIEALATAVRTLDQTRGRLSQLGESEAAARSFDEVREDGLRLPDGELDEAEWALLRSTALTAQQAAQDLRAKEQRGPTQNGMRGCDDTLPTAQELVGMRSFCVQYTAAEAAAKQRLADAERKAEAERAHIAAGRRLRGVIVAVAAVLLLGAVGLIGAWFARPDMLLMILGMVLLIGGAGALLIALLRGRKTKAAQDALAAIGQQTERERRQLAGLQQGLYAVLDGLRAYGEAQDAATALVLIGTLESRLTQAEQEKKRRLADEVALAALYDQAEAALAAFEQRWHYGALPTVQDAPMAVERLWQACRERAAARERRAALQEQRAAMERTINEGEATLAVMLQSYPAAPEADVASAWLMQQRQQVLRLREEIAAQEQSLAQFVAQASIDVEALSLVQGTDEPEEGAEDFAGARLALEQAHDEIGRQLTLLQRKAEQLSESAARLDTLEPQLSEAEATLARQREALSTVELTRTHMEKAKKQLSERYLVQMKNSFSEYHAALTASEGVSFTMDGSFRIKLRAGGVQRSTDSFSVGQRDMLSLCARLALVDALFEREAPFLVLDDPFVNLDDVTVARAHALLRVAAEKYQILYLTCHSSRG
ncbi:MAG: AAA family ATPase [Clostridia bacterium]|nr:AAA family ATPase [Clostridia bacterium]